MATGTTIDFTDTRDQIITDAFALIGKTSEDKALNSYDLETGKRWLNRLIAMWQKKRYTDEFATIFLAKGTNTYSLGNAATDAKWSNTVIEIDLATALAAAATAVTVSTTNTTTGTTGMTVGDNIGIVLTSGVLFWTTIATIPSTTTLTLTSGVTTAAAAGNLIYTFTSRALRPLSITNVVRRELLGTSLTDIYMNRASASDYHKITTKQAEGTPSQWTYDPKISTGVFKIWNTPTETKHRLLIQYQRPLYDFDLATDNPDLPKEYLTALSYNLALLLCAPYGQLAKVALLLPQASYYLKQAYERDHEDGDIFFSPSDDGFEE